MIHCILQYKYCNSKTIATYNFSLLTTIKWQTCPFSLYLPYNISYYKIMIKHIVFWKLKETAHGNSKTENAKLIKDKLEALNGKINGLIRLEVGINFLESEANYDVALYSELDSKESLDIYQNHPLHQALLPFVREAVDGRVAVDYEL